MNGITYYRLKSDYTGDYTKNAALNGVEVDNNFYVLEGRDVKSIAVKDKDIILTLMNGDCLSAEGVLDFAKPEDIKNSIIKVEFDTTNGTLNLIYADGTIQEIEGFSTTENNGFSVSTDNTLWGDGLRGKPLGVSPLYRTGQFKTVKSIINVTDGGTLPVCGNVLGDRYITCEDISDYGYLYDYCAVREIATELQNSGWRIPTKADWDDLLNSVEPCEGDRDHEKADKNRILGKWAGKLLKSKTMWKDGCTPDGCDGGCDDTTPTPDCGCNKPKKKCGCEKHTCIDYSEDKCNQTNASESNCKSMKQCDDHMGLDAFGFRVTPAGYADDGCNFSYFKERSAFWTATTNENNTKAYIKRFQYNKDGVYQDVIPSNYHLSLRLVKDYDGKNYFDVEEILDMDYPTLLLPSKSKGKSIWMSANLAYSNASLKPMTPNDGQGLTYTRHYFINEWNGFKWVRNEMKQGDSVVVAKAPKGKTMVEYRVIGDDLISVNEMIYSDVLSEVKPLIDAEIEARQDAIEELSELLEKEIAARSEADGIIQDDLIAEIDERKAEIQRLEDLIQTLQNNTLALQQAIDDEKAARIDADSIIQDDLIAEIDERKAKDIELQQKIDDEAAIRKANDDALQSNLDDEINARKAADTQIEGKLLNVVGTEFNPQTGVLTLKSNDGTNDINVQFTFNMGSF